MESNPGNPNPDLDVLWSLILTQYAAIVGLILLLIFVLWLVPHMLSYQSRAAKIRQSPKFIHVPWITVNETRESHGMTQSSSSDLWFTDDANREELYRDFSNN